MATVFEPRIRDAVSLMHREGMQAMLLTDPVNIRYFTGYWTILSGKSPTALVIDSVGKTKVFFPALEGQSLQDMGAHLDEAYPWRVYSLTVSESVVSPRTFSARLREVMEGFPTGCTLGTDENTGIDPAVVLKGIRQAPVSRSLAALRLVKRSEELRDLECSFNICAIAVDSARRGITAGVTETHLAGLIAQGILGNGGLAAHIVIGSGPRAAMAHPLPTGRKIGVHDPVMIDIGVVYNGYWTELARTYVIEPTQEWVTRHELVKRAQSAGVKAIRIGARACDVDLTIREVFTQAGYDGKYFTHSAGHGCGLMGADGPSISPSDEGLLEAPSVWSLEPALYFSGEGGIRLEDAFLLDREGQVRPLMAVPYDLKP